MTEILTLLFDRYTKNLYTSGVRSEIQEAEDRYQQLKELAGEDIALDIWDAAVAEGAVMQEVYFRAGLKTGLALARELQSL